MILFSNRLRARFIKYVIVGSFGLAVDMTIFNLLAQTEMYRTVDFFPLLARTLSALFSMAVVFGLNQSFTFGDIEFRFNLQRRAFLYACSQVIGFALITLPFVVSRYFLGIDSLIVDNLTAGLIGPSLAFVFRYWFSVRFTFVNKESARLRT